MTQEAVLEDVPRRTYYARGVSASTLSLYSLYDCFYGFVSRIYLFDTLYIHLPLLKCPTISLWFAIVFKEKSERI